ncbi:hypothetical protein ACQY0O_005537 [Thecaphora frezii]
MPLPGQEAESQVPSNVFEASFDKTFATAGTNISADESMDDCNLNISYSGLSGINQFNSMVDKLLTKDILNSPTLHSGSPSKLG